MGKSTGSRNISSFLVVIIAAAAGALHAEPTPSSSPPSRTPATARSAPVTPLREGWNYVKGEWVHSEGYKYVNGRVVRTTAPPHKRPPRPPSQALLNAVKTKPSPTPEPNSAAAKAAEKERNLRPRPAPQTGTHL